MCLHTSRERCGLRGSPRGGGLALREAHLLLVLFGKRNGTWRNCQPGRWLRVRAMHDLRVQKSRDASGIFFVASAAEGRGCRARVPSRAPRSRPARAEKIQGTRAKLSNRLFIVFTHAPPRARTRIRPYPRGCSPRTRGSSSQRSFSPSLRRGGDTRRGRRCLCPPPKFKPDQKATVLFFVA